MSKTAAASDLYPAVYSYLKMCGHTKTAAQFLKETRTKESTSEYKLLDIYREYVAAKAKNDESSDSDSSDSDSSEDEKPVAKPAAVAKKAESSSDSDSDSGSDSDSSEDEKPAPAKRGREDSAVKGNATKRMRKEESSDSDGDSDGDSDDSDSDSDSSESESSSDEEEHAATVKKRQEERARKAKESAAAAAAWVSKSPAATVTSANKRPAGEKRTPGEAFTRVDAEIWNKEVLEGLEDNSYEKAFGVDGYGAKASAVLMTVRGKDFRHEKTKKKRGSYRGGEITLASNSFKYSE